MAFGIQDGKKGFWHLILVISLPKKYFFRALSKSFLSLWMLTECTSAILSHLRGRTFKGWLDVWESLAGGMYRLLSFLRETWFWPYVSMKETTIRRITQQSSSNEVSWISWEKGCILDGGRCYTARTPFHKQASGNIFKDDVNSFFLHLGYFLLWYFLRKVGFLTFSKKCMAIDDRPEELTGEHGTMINKKKKFFSCRWKWFQREEEQWRTQKTSKISLSKNTQHIWEVSPPNPLSYISLSHAPV